MKGFWSKTPPTKKGWYPVFLGPFFSIAYVREQTASGQPLVFQCVVNRGELVHGTVQDNRVDYWWSERIPIPLVPPRMLKDKK